MHGRASQIYLLATQESVGKGQLGPSLSFLITLKSLFYRNMYFTLVPYNSLMRNLTGFAIQQE